MRWNKIVTIVAAHAEGEIGRVITGGVVDIPGVSVLEKMHYLKENDELRKFVNQEPRGCAQMTTNLLLPPSDTSADAAFIPMQADATHPMSGSNAMCVTTVLLETGMLPMLEPETCVILDTAAGLVQAKATCNDGKVTKVALQFFPAYAAYLETPIEVEGLGTINVDVGFGGVFYVMPDVSQLGFRIGPDVAQDMVFLGNRIKNAAREQLSVQHPENAGFNSIDFLMFTDAVEKHQNAFRNATIMPPGRVDRSPCGTGSAARLAAMYAKKQIRVGDCVEMRSTINSRFQCQILHEKMVGKHRGIIPTISGCSWIYATMQLGVDPSDPYSLGYTLADTWGDGIEHIIPNE